jgi:V/A-type H+-transporting ATPase subunit I
MAVLKMDKIRLFVHRSKGTEVLRVLQRMGLVEFIQIEASEQLNPEIKTTFEFNYISSRVDYAVEYLSHFSVEPSGLQAMLDGGKKQLSYAEMEKEVHSFYFNDIVEQVQDTEIKLNDAKAKVKELEDEARLLVAWKHLDLSLSHGLETRLTKTFTVRGSATEIELLVEQSSEKSILVLSEEISESHYLLTILKENEIEFKQLMSINKVEAIQLPRRRGTPSEELDRISRALVVANQKIERRIERLHELTKYLPKLRVTSDYFRWKKEKHNVLTSTVGTGSVLLFEGWIPKKYKADLAKEIEKITPLFEMVDAEIKDDDKIPVELENKGGFKAFETVTRLYGVPGIKDLDPTPFLASFFILFFALSLTDVGYGLLLAVVTGFILWRYKVPSETRPMIQLMLFGGLTTFVIGIIFGGYLGIDIAAFPEPIQALAKFNPITAPLPVLFLALGLGVVQIMTGFILKIIRDAKNGDLIGGLLDRGPWLMLFITLGLYIANAFGYLPDMGSIYKWATLSSVGLIVVTQGRNEQGILKKMFTGVLSLYDVVAYFSDILSYSRLLALGLATSALAFAINLIAILMKDMIPVIGPIVMVVILVIGHLFNLAVNMLGAFIHSARLQFVEFFGKFIVDSGREFKPFRRSGRFIIIK